MAKTFVGFGFGPIQSGLFLFEAHASGNFSRYVVAEVDESLVEGVRRNRGRCAVNVARRDRIERSKLDRIEIYDPRVPADRERIVAAVSESDEMATALPSVDFYDSGPASVARLAAEGLSRRTGDVSTIIYAAENHNRAAEILREKILAHARPAALSAVATLNTVIGKMSSVITDRAVISSMGLATITPEVQRAVLVEEFNRILISRIALAGFRRGIEVFIEKDDLLPFEEAKLYGHNAIHAVIAYLADLRGFETIAHAGRDAWIMSVARRAFIDESGAALVARHGRLGDPLFTPEGYREYAEDLLERMVRPTLNDLVWRVGRDHVRKLGYDDRLYGTMHLALEYGIEPKNLALGAAAAVLSLIKRQVSLGLSVPHLPRKAEDLTEGRLAKLLSGIWSGHAGPYAERLIALTWSALEALGKR